MKNPILLPLFAMVIHSFLVLIFMFLRRRNALKNKEIRLSYFSAYNSEIPDCIATPARHFTNLFETPVLFYAAGILAIVLNENTLLQLGCAWGYVGLRFLHSIIHLGKNNIMHRAFVFFLSYMLIIAMWANLVCSNFSEYV
jgi:hypothetical protein